MAEVIPKKSASGMLKGIYNSIHRKLGKEDKRKVQDPILLYIFRLIAYFRIVTNLI